MRKESVQQPNDLQENNIKSRGPLSHRNSERNWISRKPRKKLHSCRSLTSFKPIRTHWYYWLHNEEILVFRTTSIQIMKEWTNNEKEIKPKESISDWSSWDNWFPRKFGRNSNSRKLTKNPKRARKTRKIYRSCRFCSC